MFERYTEKARRVIFFSRYEASQFGSPYIETEHLLLGVLREDPALAMQFDLVPETIRKEIESGVVIRAKTSTSVDLPLSNESKRVLAYAAEEAERLGHKHIGTEHLVLGLLREQRSMAATLLNRHGVSLDAARKIKAASVDGKAKGLNMPLQSPSIAFIENGKALSISAVMFILPRTGEEIVLNEGQSGTTFVVEKVRFVLTSEQAGPTEGQTLQKIEIHVRRV
jgi:ATP-dependent Clp protease ATP-binding subunit ClpA